MFMMTSVEADVEEGIFNPKNSANTLQRESYQVAMPVSADKPRKVGIIIMSVILVSENGTRIQEFKNFVPKMAQQGSFPNTLCGRAMIKTTQRPTIKIMIALSEVVTCLLRLVI
jgi:hypothetical protein